MRASVQRISTAHSVCVCVCVCVSVYACVCVCVKILKSHTYVDFTQSISCELTFEDFHVHLRDDDEASQMEESYEIPLYESLHGSHSSRHGHVDVSHGPGDTSSRHFSEPHQRHNHPTDNRTCSSYTSSQNGDRHHAKEKYIYAAEPYISAKETFISAREHDASNAESEFAHDSALVRKLEAAQSGENLFFVFF